MSEPNGGTPPPGPEAPTERAGYTLIVGVDGQDRAWVEGTLLRGGLEVASMTEADVLVSRDLVPPKLVVFDDVGIRTDRQGSLRRLEAHPQLVGVPLLVLAYDADIDSFTDAITRGAAAYLVKPVGADELIAVAQRLSGWKGATDRTEKRRRLRRPLLMRVDVDFKSTKRRVPGQMVDVSGGGCRIELTAECPKGELIRIILHGHDASTHLALGGEVRWHRIAPSGTHVIGVRFTGTTALLAPKLLGFVSSGMT